MHLNRFNSTPSSIDRILVNTLTASRDGLITATMKLYYSSLASALLLSPPPIPSITLPSFVRLYPIAVLSSKYVFD